MSGVCLGASEDVAADREAFSPEGAGIISIYLSVGISVLTSWMAEAWGLGWSSER